MIETKTIPVPPWKGLFLDGVTVPGGMSKANNVFVLPDGSVERRLFQRTLDESPGCLSSRGLKKVYELRKSDGTRYVFADIERDSAVAELAVTEESDTTISAFGAELITHFATWTDVADWSYGSSKWTHAATGATALVATSEPAVVAASTYRVVVDITQTPPTTSESGWTYTNTGGVEKWTHAATGTTALTFAGSFNIIAGQSYAVNVYADHVSGGGVSVWLGGKLLGKITATGQRGFLARFVTDTTSLRFVPDTDWVGSINRTYPFTEPSVLYIRRLIDPAGTSYSGLLGDYYGDMATPGGTGVNHDFSIPVLMPPFVYAESASQLSQSLVVSIGSTTCGTITASGVYSYTTTATDTDALTFTPSTSWDGSVNSASSMLVTITTVSGGTTPGSIDIPVFGVAGSMKIIGGAVTGTTDYETSWTNVKTGLIGGDSVRPMWATMKDRAYRVDGKNPNMSFADATLTAGSNIGIAAPQLPPTVANTTGGDITAGDYSVFYTYVKRATNYESEGNPSLAGNVTVAGNAITVGVVANTEAGVTHIRIYRTLYSEQGAAAYLAAEVLNVTQTVTLTSADDVIGDSGIVLEYTHDTSKVAMFVLTGGSRLWLLRFPNEVGGDSMVMWSDTNNPESFPAINYQTLDIADGDKIMGAAMLKDNLLIFKRHRTYLLNMYSFGKDIVSPKLGCIASGSIQTVGANSAIWLSSEGLMLFDGGQTKNISKDRINSVINLFMANGAEYFIDSVYHSTRRQYHINLLYRNAAGTAIVAQRHFVYALDSDAWTEYVYTSDGGVRYYEINFCLASDSNLNEVILIPYLTSTTGTVAYIYQTDYEPTPSVSTSYEYSVYQNTNDDVTIARDVVIYYPPKYASLWLNLFISHNRMTDFTTISAANLDNFYGPTEILNLENGIYLALGANGNGVDSSYAWIIRSTDYGATWASVLKENTYGAAYHISYAVNMGGGNILTGTTTLADESVVSYKSADYGLTWTSTTYTEYACEPLAYAGNNIVLGNGTGVGHIWRSTNGGTTWADLGLIISDPITHAAEAVIAIGYLGNGIALAGNNGSDTREIYRSTDYGATWVPITVSPIIYGINRILNIGNGIALIGSTSTSGSIYRTTDYGLTWINVLTGYNITELSYAGYGVIYAGINSNGILYSNNYGLTWTAHNAIPAGGLTYTITPIVSETTIINSTSNWVAGTGAGTWTGTGADTGTGAEMDNTYTPIPSNDNGYWQIVSDSISNGELAPNMSGCIVDIVSNYEDLGMGNDKRVKRMYLDVESQYATCGYATIEPDYGVNKYVHANNETTEPTGATSLRPFAHPGRQTWDYTNDQFDGAVEAWQDTRLDLGTQGKAFRYSVKIGDIPSANHGILRIRPPKIDVQLKGKT